MPQSHIVACMLFMINTLWLFPFRMTKTRLFIIENIVLIIIFPNVLLAFTTYNIFNKLSFIYQFLIIIINTISHWINILYIIKIASNYVLLFYYYLCFYKLKFKLDTWGWLIMGKGLNIFLSYWHFNLGRITGWRGHRPVHN